MNFSFYINSQIDEYDCTTRIRSKKAKKCRLWTYKLSANNENEQMTKIQSTIFNSSSLSICSEENFVNAFNVWIQHSYVNAIFLTTHRLINRVSTLWNQSKWRTINIIQFTLSFLIVLQSCSSITSKIENSLTHLIVSLSDAVFWQKSKNLSMHLIVLALGAAFLASQIH